MLNVGLIVFVSFFLLNIKNSGIYIKLDMRNDQAKYLKVMRQMFWQISE